MVVADHYRGVRRPAQLLQGVLNGRRMGFLFAAAVAADHDLKIGGQPESVEQRQGIGVGLVGDDPQAVVAMAIEKVEDAGIDGGLVEQMFAVEDKKPL